ncbi:hypothetical protein [Amycolatopsis sp. PS_44_ISF1]|uniref:hypothetical protein n=1 Tax=Amycolatopsis sp. PS_44_ISF1 TaxID=2974917 RepID=UPI0028DF02E2|nr:hypothetical protein [Amycolatopsis sp. PS_44_ISF1]MDT8910245.1 hypothetical protein [Amycolatopsis sp. PS_44_ISF1]
MNRTQLADEVSGRLDADDDLDGPLRELLAAYARGGRPREITVVGNAPMPPDARRAELVDGSDLVIRMTTFAVDEPEAPPVYGTRTDVVVVHRGLIASPHTFADYTSRLYLLAEPGRLFWEPETLPDWWPADLGFVPISNRRFVVPLVRLLGLDPAQPQWATTGTLVAYLCRRLFPDAVLRLTGVSILDRPDQTDFEHAWGDKVGVTAEHRLHAESSLLNLWRETGRIEIVQ